MLHFAKNFRPTEVRSMQASMPDIPGPGGQDRQKNKTFGAQWFYFFVYPGPLGHNLYDVAGTGT